MAQGFSLHIGLNGVDPTKYNGWAGTLSGCVNDANAMQAICQAQGLTTQLVLNEDATADAILGNIGQAAHNLDSGDTFVLTYSGHGGQVPDDTGDSPNGLDDTWVAYDRMVLGHELYNLWSQFKPGVRIEVYSDSCHSGTVVRELLLADGSVKWPGGQSSSVGLRNFSTVFAATSRQAHKDAIGLASPQTVTAFGRGIPPSVGLQHFNANRVMYRSIMWTRPRADIGASVILISGCQDNQLSQDGLTNGLFTEKLLAVWNNGAFTGTLPQFHTSILALMPPDQTPNYFTLGVDDDVFTNSQPFSIVGDRANPAGSGTGSGTTDSSNGNHTVPSVTGPSSYERTMASPPSFIVTPGANRYWIFEMASDPAAFGDPSRRSPGTFYASWADPSGSPRETGMSFSLPAAAWQALKGNARLYYRVGSTSSRTGWDNYMVSTTDGDADMAPAMTVYDTKDVPFAAYPRTA